MDKIDLTQHGNLQRDALDQLLFASAKQITGAMDFQAAFEALHAKRQKRLARRKNAIRYLSFAATLVIGLGVGALYGRQTAPPLPLPTPGLEASATPDMGGQGIMTAEPPGLAQPDNIVIQPPTLDDDIVIVDPPKTDGGTVTYEYGEDIALANIPATKDISKLLPGWLPDNFSNVQYESAYGNWSSYNTYSGSIYADLNLGYPLFQLDDLAIGSARPVFTHREYEPQDAMNEFSYIVRLKEDVYMTVAFYQVSPDDALKVMQNIGA